MVSGFCSKRCPPPMPKLSLNAQILLGALAGVLLGFVFKWQEGSRFAEGGLYLCGLVGGAFIDLLKMVLIPLVFSSIAVGIANLRGHDSMHRVWRHTLAYFLTATTLATLLGLASANVFEPGAGLVLDMFRDALSQFDAKRLSLDEFFVQFFHELFVNPVTAMAQGQILATVVFALFLGIAFVVSGDRSKHLLALTTELLELVMLMVGWIMNIAPLGILALLAKLTATQDLAVFASLAKFVTVVLGGILFHGFVVLPLFLWLTTGHGLPFFLRGAREALITAFATCSSSATLPITLRCTERNLGVDKNIAGFVPPLGATLNMDGTALYEAAAALFVANLTGIELNLLEQMVVCFTAILASIGAPGIPSAGMVTMVMVLQSVGLPTEAIAILLPVDRLLDAFRTMINVEGDMIGSLIVQRWAKRSG